MITFDFDGVRGHIHIWRGDVIVRLPELKVTTLKDMEDYARWENKHFNFIWSALGNTGEEETQEKAIDAARNWVRGVITNKSKET